MKSYSLKKILSESPFFEGMSPEHLKIINGCAKNVTYKADQHIFHQWGEANEFYLLRKGSVSLEMYSTTPKPIVIQTINSGEILGCSWLFEPYNWRFTARVLTPVLAIAMDGVCLRQKCEENHDLGYELMKRFSHVLLQRLQATRGKLLHTQGFSYEEPLKC